MNHISKYCMTVTHIETHKIIGKQAANNYITLKFICCIAEKFGELTPFEHLVEVWQINGSANRLLIVCTNLDGFSLANHRRFVKFAKLSPRQTFPLYGMVYMADMVILLSLLGSLSTMVTVELDKTITFTSP